jgi:hypothetical protein
LALLVLYFTVHHHTMVAEVIIGLPVIVYIQYSNFGFSPHVFLHVPQQVHNALQTLFITFSSHTFLADPLSNISARYLTVDSSVVLPERVGSWWSQIYIFLIKGNTTILFGLIDSLFYHISVLLFPSLFVIPLRLF